MVKGYFSPLLCFQCLLPVEVALLYAHRALEQWTGKQQSWEDVQGVSYEQLHS